MSPPLEQTGQFTHEHGPAGTSHQRPRNAMLMQS